MTWKKSCQCPLGKKQQQKKTGLLGTWLALGLGFGVRCEHHSVNPGTTLVLVFEEQHQRGDIRPCLFLDSPHFNAIQSLLTLPTLQLILPNLVRVVWAAEMSKPHSSQPPPPTFPWEHRAIPRSEIKSLQCVMCLPPDLLLVRYV